MWWVMILPWGQTGRKTNISPPHTNISLHPWLGTTWYKLWTVWPLWTRRTLQMQPGQAETSSSNKVDSFYSFFFCPNVLHHIWIIASYIEGKGVKFKSPSAHNVIIKPLAIDKVVGIREDIKINKTAYFMTSGKLGFWPTYPPWIWTK